MLSPETKRRAGPNSGIDRLEISAFSDSFVISGPIEEGDFLLAMSADIARAILSIGFLTRGGLTFGETFHNGSVLFGPAMIEAVDLEQHGSQPRIIVTREARAALATTFSERELQALIVEDILGRQVVNLFVHPGRFRGAGGREAADAQYRTELGLYQRP